MTPSKAKGTACESAVVRWLRANGFPSAERRALSGGKDRGDIAGLPGVVLEVKNCAKLDLAGWLAEAAVEAANDRSPIYAVVHKKRGTTDPGEWYATMPFAVLAQLVGQ